MPTADSGQEHAVHARAKSAQRGEGTAFTWGGCARVPVAAEAATVPGYRKIATVAQAIIREIVRGESTIAANRFRLRCPGPTTGTAPVRMWRLDGVALGCGGSRLLCQDGELTESCGLNKSNTMSEAMTRGP